MRLSDGNLHREPSKKTKLAFGIDPSNYPYRLRLARYMGMSEAIETFLSQSPLPTHKLLDIGVGSGRSMRYLDHKGLSDKIEFYGIDLNPERLDTIFGKTRWNLQKGDLEKGLPFPDAFFDICICEQVLEHLYDPVSSLKELQRVVRPEGLLVLGVPIFPRPFAFLRNFYIQHFGLPASSDHRQTFSLTSIRKLVHSFSFEILQQQGFRIVSGGLLRPLENYFWWYQFNRKIGRLFPSCCVEIQLILKRLPTTFS